MKIAFNRKERRSPWGGGAHFATTLGDYLTKVGHTVVHQLEDGIDAIIMLDPRPEEGGFDAGAIHTYVCSHPKTKVLHRINDTDVARGTHFLDPIIMGANALVADVTVFISRWVADYYDIKGLRPSHYATVITNGCDTNVFYPPGWTSTEWSRIRAGSDGKIFYPPGFDKPHKPLRLVTHHWSNNPMKGLDLYERIDDLIDVGAPLEFTYIGRYPATHVPKHTKIIPALYGMELGDELRKHDVYVTGARYEACGSHHVEGAACGLPVVYHANGGGVNEMCSRYGVEIQNVGQIKTALEAIVRNYKAFADKAQQADLSAETMCEQYLDLIVRMTC